MNINKLTPEEEDKIRKLHAAGELSQGALARRFGVGQATVHRVISGPRVRDKQAVEIARLRAALGAALECVLAEDRVGAHSVIVAALAQKEPDA